MHVHAKLRRYKGRCNSIPGSGNSMVHNTQHAAHSTHWDQLNISGMFEGQHKHSLHNSAIHVYTIAWNQQKNKATEILNW